MGRKKSEEGDRAQKNVLQYNSHLGKHNFQVSGSQDITSNGAVKLGYSVNYMNQNIKNRPYRTVPTVPSLPYQFDRRGMGSV